MDRAQVAVYWPGPEALGLTATDSPDVYRAPFPYRLLVHMPAGYTPATLEPGVYVAILEWVRPDQAARPGEAGASHRLVRLIERVSAPQKRVWLLTDLIRKSPRADRRGGARGPVGRRPRGDEPGQPSSLNLEPADWEYLDRLGDGNRTEAVRQLIAWARAEKLERRDDRGQSDS